MPLLGSLLVSLFGSVAVFLAKFVGVRVAGMAAAFATFTALTAAVYVAAGVLAATVAASFPGIVMTGVWLFVPDNAPLCVSAMLATDVMVALYRWNLGGLRLVSSVG